MRNNRIVEEMFDNFTEMAQINTLLVNDIYSFRKDIKHNLYNFNYVYQKYATNGGKISIQTIADTIVEEINESFIKMNDLVKEFREHNIPGLVDCIEAAIHFCYANLYYSAGTDRYHKVVM